MLKLLAVDQVDVWAVLGVLELGGVVLDILEDIVVEFGGIGGVEEFDLGDFVELVDILLGLFQNSGGVGLESDALLRYEKIDVVVVLLLEVCVG